MRFIVLGLLLSAAPVAVMAQQTTPPDDAVYQLGELQVTAHARTGEDVGGTVVTGEELQTYDKQNVSEALDLIPGANASATGGSRNEGVVYVRGFNRFEVPLSVDGVRIFLPADNRIDFNQFLTADLSEIQVSKGYVSVLDGPGGLGGAINLVTIKPTKTLEGSFEATTYLDQDLNQEAYLFAGRIGGRTDHFYWQASGETTDRDYFELSHNFTPTPLQAAGPRNNSESNDWTANFKVGFTPNDTDEYSVNYTKQEGSKDAPYSTTDATNARFWSWPYWNTDSLALLTKTKLGGRWTLKTRIYDNGFDNLLSAFDTAAQTTQTTPKSFNSFYRDRAAGGDVELDYDLNDTSKLSGVLYGRRDVHDEREDGVFKNGPSLIPFSEPWQGTDEYTYSAALQYATSLTHNIDLTLGASYDWSNLLQADDVNETAGPGNAVIFQPVHYPLKDNSAPDGQGALVWRVDDDTSLHFSISDRARFPTIFERFSSKMGAAIPNPDVGPERAINYEIGGDRKFGDHITASGAIFYSDLTDALVSIAVTDPVFGVVSKTENVGGAHYYGAEASLDWRLTPTLDLGGNFTYIERDFTNDVVDAQGVPRFKTFLYAAWEPLPKLTIRPSIEADSSRWTVTTAAPIRYYKTGDYTLFNLSADYAFTDKITATLAVKNIGDQNYVLTDGFPSEGRSFYATLRARF
jgi:iron complex outermembrane receptor protein